MTKGQGSLALLEELKAEYRERFKAEAPRVKRVDIRCFRLRCPTALNPRNMKYTYRGLRVAKSTCTRKTCPRLTLAKYLEMLERTKAFRQRNDDMESHDFWWDIVEWWKAKLRGMLHIEEA